MGQIVANTDDYTIFLLRVRIEREQRVDSKHDLRRLVRLEHHLVHSLSVAKRSRRGLGHNDRVIKATVLRGDAQMLERVVQNALDIVPIGDEQAIERRLGAGSERGIVHGLPEEIVADQGQVVARFPLSVF